MAKKGKVEEVVVEAPKIIEEKTGKSQFIFPDGSKYDGEWLSKDRYIHTCFVMRWIRTDIFFVSS